MTQITEKKVFAHLLTWFKARPFSGEWQMWNSEYEAAPADPDTILFNGRREIAANSYPLTDVYDTSDPHLIEYQLLSMRLAGIDGVIIDWDGRRINPYRHQCLLDVLPHLAVYGMELMLCFEEWCGYWPKGTHADRDDEINAAVEELRWMARTVLSMPNYAKVRGKSPVLVFRKIADQWFAPAEWAEIQRRLDYPEAGFLFDNGCIDDFADVASGFFYWIGGFFPEKSFCTVKDGEAQYAEYLSKAKASRVSDGVPIVMGGVVPGFDDSPVWGWGGFPRVAPRLNGDRYHSTWRQSREADIDLVQIITWNDWNEGSHIEPADTFGYEYLERTQEQSAVFKACGRAADTDDLRLPLELFKRRKKAAQLGSNALKAETRRLDETRRALLDGRFSDARKSLKIDTD